jgi:hypothetical protein
MSNINKTIKNSIRYSLILLVILGFGVITFMAVEANAYYGYYGGTSIYNDELENQGNGYQSPSNNPEPTVNPKPSVNSISPKSANVGSGSKNVTVIGNGFVPSSVARWNGSDRPTTFIDPSHLVIHLSSSDMQGSSGRYITVWSPALSFLHNQWLCNFEQWKRVKKHLDQYRLCKRSLRYERN